MVNKLSISFDPVTGIALHATVLDRDKKNRTSRRGNTGSEPNTTKAKSHSVRCEPTKMPTQKNQSPVHKQAKRNRCRPHRKAIRPVSLFLHMLPGEIRNKIYEYVIPEARVLVCNSKPAVAVRAAQQLWENEGKPIMHPRSHLYCILDRGQLTAGLEMSTALLLVNRQINQEATYFLYSQTTFCFSSLKTVSRFVNSAPKLGISSIKKLELETHCYGEPYLTKYRPYKERFDRKWETVCKMINSQMTSLTHLNLHSRCLEWPFGSIEQTVWFQSLMHITESKKLDHVGISLAYPWLSSKRLEQLERKLEKTMMSSKAQQKRDEMEMAERARKEEMNAAIRAAEELKKNPSQSAPKCLRIMVKEIGGTESNQTVEEKQEGSCPALLAADTPAQSVTKGTAQQNTGVTTSKARPKAKSHRDFMGSRPRKTHQKLSTRLRNTVTV